MANNVNVNAGSSISTILLVQFIVLKLIGVIHWSWWWVLSPLWISVGLVGVVFIVATIVVAILAAVGS